MSELEKIEKGIFDQEIDKTKLSEVIRTDTPERNEFENEQYELTKNIEKTEIRIFKIYESYVNKNNLQGHNNFVDIDEFIRLRKLFIEYIENNNHKGITAEIWLEVKIVIQKIEGHWALANKDIKTEDEQSYKLRKETYKLKRL